MITFEISHGNSLSVLYDQIYTQHKSFIFSSTIYIDMFKPFDEPLPLKLIYNFSHLTNL